VKVTPQPVAVETTNILATNRAVFINFMKELRYQRRHYLWTSVDLMSLYRNIPQEEGIPNRIQSIRLFLSIKFPSHATTRMSAEAYPTGKFLPI